MLNYSVSFLPAIISAVVAFIVGFIWWGPLFGMKWAKLIGMTSEDMKKAKQKSMAKPAIIMLIGNFIMSYILSILFLSLGITMMAEALTLGILVWLGFVATIGIGIVLWENKSMSLFWINSIGWLVTILVMSTVQMMF